MAQLLGFLNINKPAGKTSHDVVAAVRRIIRIKQVGHSGTLDPMAEGVLLIAVGKACRLLRFIDGRKTYLAKIQFGLVTTTDDVEGEPLDTSDAIPHEGDIKKVLPSFEGAISQVPPMYSAIHVGGKRLYELAREGKQVAAIPERNVFVHYIQFLEYKAPFLTARISCSSGTYIRSIARDLGQMLGCGGCLAGLTREQVGPFQLNGALTLDQLKEHADAGTVERALISPEQVVSLETIELDSEQTRQLRLGQAITVHSAEVQTAQEHVLAIYNGEVVAVCRQMTKDESALVKMQPEVVLTNA